MSLEINFSLINSMYWAFFIGMSFTLGVGFGVMFLAFFQQKLSPKNDKETTSKAE